MDSAVTETYTDRQRVAYVWLLVVAAFLLFNGIYWPLTRYQQARDPAHFMETAEHLIGRGDLVDARRILESGIEAFHPPLPEPYAFLREVLLEDADEELRLQLAASTAFYAYRNAIQHDAVALRDALLPLSRHMAPGSMTPAAEAGIAVLMYGLLGESAGPILNVWPPADQLALLAAAQGEVSLDGRIGDTEFVSPVDILVQSCGYHADGRAPHLLVNGQELAERKRGIHVALVNAETGSVVHTGLFDIWDSEAESDRLATILEEAEEETIGIFTVYDDASVNLTHRLVRAMKQFGLVEKALVNRRPRLFGLRFSFAAVGVKQATPTRAMQAWAPSNFNGALGHPVSVVVLAPREGAQP